MMNLLVSAAWPTLWPSSSITRSQCTCAKAQRVCNCTETVYRLCRILLVSSRAPSAAHNPAQFRIIFQVIRTQYTALPTTHCLTDDSGARPNRY